MTAKQDSVRAVPADSVSNAQLNQKSVEFIQRMMTPGIRMDSAKIHFDDEVKRIVTDTAYRDSIYRQPYTWSSVSAALQSANIRLGVYQMINLYPTDREEVVRYIAAYDQVVKADVLVEASFYTYAMLDPRISSVEGGKPMIHRPDLLEELFRYANEISAYVVAARSKQPATAPPRQQK